MEYPGSDKDEVFALKLALQQASESINEILVTIEHDPDITSASIRNYLKNSLRQIIELCIPELRNLREVNKYSFAPPRRNLSPAQTERLNREQRAPRIANRLPPPMDAAEANFQPEPMMKPAPSLGPAMRPLPNPQNEGTNSIPDDQPKHSQDINPLSMYPNQPNPLMNPFLKGNALPVPSLFKGVVNPPPLKSFNPDPPQNFPPFEDLNAENYKRNSIIEFRQNSHQMPFANSLVYQQKSPELNPPSLGFTSNIGPLPLGGPAKEGPPVLRGPISLGPPPLGGPVKEGPPPLGGPVKEGPPALRGPPSLGPPSMTYTTRLGCPPSGFPYPPRLEFNPSLVGPPPLGGFYNSSEPSGFTGPAISTFSSNSFDRHGLSGPPSVPSHPTLSGPPRLSASGNARASVHSDFPPRLPQTLNAAYPGISESYYKPNLKNSHYFEPELQNIPYVMKNEALENQEINISLPPPIEKKKTRENYTEKELECLACTDYRVQADQTRDECHICILEFEDNCKITFLNCLHRFHTNCLKQWLLKKNECPVCITKVFIEQM